MIWFRSKVDWWMALALCTPPVASVAVCLSFLLNGMIRELPWGIAGVLFVAVLYFGLVVPVRYGLDEHCLEINFGMCRSRIEYSSIEAVKPTRNPLSAPALSLDRLEINYGEGMFGLALISPADREHFLRELASRAGLIQEGNCLIRGDGKAG